MNRGATRPLGKFPSRQPIDVNANIWFYEYPGSIHLVFGTGITQGKIPLRLLCRVVDRYRKYKAKRRSK